MESETKILNLTDSQARWLFILLIIALVATLILSLLRGLNSQPAQDRDAETRVQMSEQVSEASSERPQEEWVQIEKTLSSQLEEILGQIEGAGRVKVMVSLATGPLKEFEKNRQTDERQTEEQDASGGTRLVSEYSESGEVVFYRVSDGREERPVIQQVIKPEIEGVLVVASGADDSRVKLVLLRAVKTLLRIDSHQIEIVPGEGGK